VTVGQDHIALVKLPLLWAIAVANVQNKTASVSTKVRSFRITCSAIALSSDIMYQGGAFKEIAENQIADEARHYDSNDQRITL